MNTHCTCDHPRILDPADVAAMLKISEGHLTNLRNDDASFPEPCWLGTLPRWHSDAIFAHVLAANTKPLIPDDNMVGSLNGSSAAAVASEAATTALKARDGKKRSSTDV